MQLKTKFFMPLLVILLMGMTTTAFAQLSCGVASTPVSRATETGHTEQAGDLIWNCTASGAVATTESRFTIDYGVPITNSTTYPGPPGNIAIANQSGSFVGAGSPVVETVNNEQGQIIIRVPAQAVPAAGSFALTEVLVSLFGSALTVLDANVSVSPGNNVFITAGQNVARVISSIRPGLDEVEADNIARFLATGVAVVEGETDFFDLKITEGYIDMYRNQAQAPTGATNSVQLMIDFAGIPGDGAFTCTAYLQEADDDEAPIVELWVSTDGDDITEFEADVDDGDNVLWVAIPPEDIEDGGGEPDLGIIEAVFVHCEDFDFSDSATPLLGSVTATVTLAPTGDALDDDEVLTGSDDGQIPRYEEELSDAITVVTFTPATTTMIVPLAMATPVTPSPLGSYDTGIAIANTTLDPWATGDDPDEGGALEQDGLLTFHFYPVTGDPFIVTPAMLGAHAG